MRRTLITGALTTLLVALVASAGIAVFTSVTEDSAALAGVPAQDGGEGGGQPPGQGVPGLAVAYAPEPPAYEELVERGAEVYAENCFVCHGGVGNGEGPWASTLSTPARDFTDKAWMESQSDGVFVTSILRGVPGTPMPSFAGRLSERDVWAVTAYIRGLSPHVRLDAVPGKEDASTVRARQGKEIFEAQCAGCHGQTGAGDGPAAASFDTKPRALSDGDWLSGRSDQQLHTTIREGVPGTSMPAFYDELSAPETDAVVAYLRDLAGVEQKENPLGGWAQETYLAYCASCHGVDGNGQGIASGRIDPEPRTFRNPTWMAGQTDAKLAEAVKNGRPGTAMPPFGAILDDAEIDRLVDYIRAFAGPEAIPGADSAYRYDPETVTGAPVDDGSTAER